MATSQASVKNRVYLFRLQTLIIDGGTIVIKNIFNQKLQSQNSTLTVCLAQEKQKITSLKNKKVITQPQYDLLFPQSGQAPSLPDFDITLTISLLRTLKMCGLNPKYNWKDTPQPTDLSVEADISRLRAYRNKVAHISETTGIQLKEFCFKWTEIEQILLRLNSSVLNPVPDLQQMIDDFKTYSLDPKAEQSLQKEIDAWREMERGLETSIKLVKEDLKMVTEDVYEIKEDVINLNKDIQKVTTNRETDSYQQKRKELLDDLVHFYRKKHATIRLSPLIAEKDTPLLAFYVLPEIQSVKVQRGLGGGKEEKTLVTNFHNLFHNKETNVFHEIYLTADAGLGKTAFSKRLALTWCQTKTPITDETEYYKQEEIKVMAKFEFIFLLLLRESSRECDIDDLILNQIIPELSHSSYSLTDLENILSKERCLVILDGLDEWTHPSNTCKHGHIPHRKARTWTVLTTTRPWKLSVSGLDSSQIDQKLEMSGLNLHLADTLKRSVISHICAEKNKNKLEQYVNDFNRAVQVKRISDLQAIPLILMFLIFIWHDKIGLGQSLFELYGSIIELLLSRSVNTCEDIPSMPEHDGNIPQFVSEKESCTHFYTLLKALGHLAFETLFGKTRENRLVFNRSVAKQY